ncbi:sugar ABC transporter ATP-binding protein [Tritonibacter scottomollicae]|uniref:sugar ABC transporter ATP-binding protein n=1 Tax=Tritonibacter scottomollicae TaxID=483013 RepID=UPI003BA969BF
MIRLDHITKIYRGVKSLDAVSFEARAGEIHALLGENGAGKSTLIKMMAGAVKPDGGEIHYDGARRQWSDPAAARDAGIHVIYQELMLFPELSVAENIFLGAQPRGRLGQIDHAAMRAQARDVLGRLGHSLDPAMRLADCSVADRQMVEIARAFVRKTRLLILDEPTAVLSPRETELLFERLLSLRAAGVCVIYISHRLEEIFALADRVTVLKDGRHVATRETRDLDREALVALMVGRDLDDIYPPKADATGEVVLSVRGLASGPKLHDVSFDLRRGEILGLAGLVGAGRTEAAQVIYGDLPRAAGQVTLAGQAYDNATPRKAIHRGLGYLTEDRKGEGLMLLLDMAANISAPMLDQFRVRGRLHRGREIAAGQSEIERFRIAIPGPRHGVAGLSGGNQQKILFARWARASRHVLILDEPTRGVDVCARMEIYGIIRQLANEGLGILVISSDLPEVVGLCDRVGVLREGRVTGEVAGAELTEQRIMSLATAEAA